MTDLARAIAALEGHSIAICRGGKVLTRDERGIMPMLSLLREGTDVRGSAVADLVVGKAAAMLFVKAGVAEVYAKTLSEEAQRYLAAHGIPVSCESLTKNIINRSGTGLCPMEETVLNTEDAEEGYRLLCEKVSRMQAERA